MEKEKEKFDYKGLLPAAVDFINNAGELMKYVFAEVSQNIDGLTFSMLHYLGDAHQLLDVVLKYEDKHKLDVYANTYPALFGSGKDGYLPHVKDLNKQTTNGSFVWVIYSESYQYLKDNMSRPHLNWCRIHSSDYADFIKNRAKYFFSNHQQAIQEGCNFAQHLASGAVPKNDSQYSIMRW